MKLYTSNPLYIFLPNLPLLKTFFDNIAAMNYGMNTEINP